MSTTDEDPLAPYRSELRAAAYRMMGSVDDAEDVLQEVSVRAWRGGADFEGRSSRRTWLHRIAFNACLNELDRKERRVLPIELTPASSDPREAVGEPMREVLWLEPFGDDPELSAEQRETVELAFVAAVQHLPPNQRAALIMFEVLGFSAAEIADAMATTPQAVNSALQRARRTLDDSLPERTQQQVLAELGDEAQRGLVERYSAALESHDLDRLLELLTEDATWSMPPLPAWFRGREAVAGFLRSGPFTVDWRHLPARANGQLAVGCYAWDDDVGAHVAYALDVLTLEGDRIREVTAFLDPARFGEVGLPLRLA